MKNEILTMLREHCPDYVSGQALCEQFGVSRTAVWKAMKQLEKEAALRAAQEAEAQAEPDVMDTAEPEFSEMPERPFVDAEGEIEEAVDADFEVEK